MGIKGLPKLIKEITNGSAMKSIQFGKFDGRVAVDMSLLIHQTVIAMRSNGRDMTNQKGELTSHLYGILYKMLTFLQNGMTPICVFDGKAPEIKNKTVDIRRSRKDAAEKNLNLWKILKMKNILKILNKHLHHLKRYSRSTNITRSYGYPLYCFSRRS
nr:DNA endonuclease [Mimivirus sp.]